MTPQVWQELCAILREGGIEAGSMPDEAVDLHQHLAQMNGVSADEALEWFARKFEILPLNPVRPNCSTRAENAFRRLAPQGGDPEIERWIPFGTLGPLVLCAHYNPACTELWEIPVELVIPVLIPQSKYVILHRDFMGRLEIQPLEPRPPLVFSAPLPKDGHPASALAWLLQEYPLEGDVRTKLERAKPELAGATVESLRSGTSECALAGGVNLNLSPLHFMRLSEARMLSPGNECKPFGSGADGMIDGEGVGAVLLKPLGKAIADGDYIYGVIKGSSVNAGGKTNGYTVPNPVAQARLVADTLARAGVDPRTISYVEAHGTGTILGDPIEIAGLTRAFQEIAKHPASDRQFCAIGSVKSNLGHCESAAGIAGLVGLASLYRAMSIGQMGTVAPVSGVVSAALPVIAGALTQGLPVPLVLLGFIFALAGVWFISRTGSSETPRAGRATSILLALLSGAGFGGFLILIAQAQHGAVFWPLAVARGASLLVIVIWSLFKRSIRLPPRNALIPIIAAGAMDAGGNLFFLLSAQAGRLDIAGVLSSLYPATTVILALTVLRERLVRSQVIGIALALIAIPLISLS